MEGVAEMLKQNQGYSITIDENREEVTENSVQQQLQLCIGLCWESWTLTETPKENSLNAMDPSNLLVFVCKFDAHDRNAIEQTQL